MNADIKAKIDAMPYAEMLYKWRFAAIGDPLFQGETGDYFAKVMKEKKPSDEERVRISKNIGWSYGRT